MKSKIREPKQNRSIEKKNKIIEASYSLFAEVGYYSTNTADIAKKAGVSTGIVYGYFQDKKDILLYVLKIYIENVSNPIKEYLNKIQGKSLIDIIPELIEMTIKMHKKNYHLHNTLHSLAQSDSKVNEQFIEFEDSLTKDISDIFIQKGFIQTNVAEKVHLSMNIIQSFAHEYIYDKHKYIDYSIMKQDVCNTIINLLK